MVFGIGEGLAVAGLAASALGGGKEGGQSVSGFAAYPQEVKDLLLEQYLPQVEKYLNAGFQAVPMQRAQNPMGDPFASQALWDMQQYSDAIPGGYFNNAQLPEGQQGGGQEIDPEAASSQLARQYLFQMSSPTSDSPRGTMINRGMGGGVGWSGQLASDLLGRIDAGNVSLSSLGNALSQQGYGDKVFSNANINYGMLLEALK
jgi:hypothetical protein